MPAAESSQASADAGVPEMHHASQDHGCAQEAGPEAEPAPGEGVTGVAQSAEVAAPQPVSAGAGEPADPFDPWADAPTEPLGGQGQ
eukprot:11000005-Alexandrium_andersonii.AAC.1